MSKTNESPQVLLRFSVPLSQSVTGVALALLMTAICAWVLFRTSSGASAVSRPLTVFVGLIGLAMLLGTLAFIRMLVQPPIMLEATPAGLVLYLNVKSGKYSTPGVLIRWHSIQHIEYYASTSRPYQLRVKSARLYLAPGHLVPIDDVSILRKRSLPFGFDGSRNTGIDWDNTIFLNAVTDFGKPETYANELEDLRKKYASVIGITELTDE